MGNELAKFKINLRNAKPYSFYIWQSQTRKMQYTGLNTITIPSGEYAAQASYAYLSEIITTIPDRIQTANYEPIHYNYATRGRKQYELTNHLGNVLATVSDKKINGSAEVLSSQDYYPFGMQMPNRGTSVNATADYRFGYQGSEIDKEVNNTRNMYTTHYRMLDTRLGRWWGIDPKSGLMPWQSPYVSMDNSPMWKNDMGGDVAPIVIYGLYVAAEALLATASIYFIADKVHESVERALNYEWERSDGQVFQCRTEQPFNEGGGMKFGNPKDPKGTATVVGVMLFSTTQLISNYQNIKKQLGIYDDVQKTDDPGFIVSEDVMKVLNNTSDETKSVLIGYVVANMEDMSDEAAEKINKVFGVMVENAKDDYYLSPEQVEGLLDPDPAVKEFMDNWNETKSDSSEEAAE